MRDLDAFREYLEANLNKPFDWGTRDCGTFAVGAIKAMTGYDALKGDRWSTKREADAFLEREGGMVAACDKRFRPISIGEAKRGDLVLAKVEGGEALCVVDSNYLVGAGRKGLVRVPRTAGIKAWSAD